MLKIVLIRHFKTAGNERKRYIGTTDEPLLQDIVITKQYPEVEAVFCSPLLRCRQTASILYPSHVPIQNDQLRECDFGLFENKNYHELATEPLYQQWIDSNGTLPFPNGESVEEFKNRCIRGFVDCMEIAIKNKWNTVAMVVHGGTIMSILEYLTKQEKSYYQWQVKNGEGYIINIERR